MKRPNSISNSNAQQLHLWLPGRDKIIFALAVQSGLRISDLLSLHVKDVRINPITVYETKSKQFRTFAINNELFDLLKKLTQWKNDDEYVFHSERKPQKPIHRSTYHRHLKKIAEWLEIDCSAHSSRKLYAQNAFSELGEVRKVQKLMNHKSILTTAAYLDIDIANIVAAAAPQSDQLLQKPGQTSAVATDIKSLKPVVKIKSTQKGGSVWKKILKKIISIFNTSSK